MKLLTAALLIKIGIMLEPNPSKCKDGKDHAFIWKEKSLGSNKTPQNGD